MQENENMETEKVLLAGVDTGEDESFEQSMKELASLAEACFYRPVGCFIQTLPAVSKALCMGSGKVEEVKAAAEAEGAGLVIFDNTLTPIQLRNLQKELGVAVLDRTGLILDIFSSRARTREAKLQVEAARLKYMLPRLVGLHDALGRQGGSSGGLSNKGAGEKKLELDRRRIEQRLAFLKRELKEVEKERRIQRRKRENSRIKKVALAGYTNAGKSTILNRMVSLYGKAEGKEVVEKDMLFATLETSVRKIRGNDHREFFLSDTVGFIHKLPHDLIEAFHATLEEVTNADLLLHVVDFSDPHYKQQMQVTKETLVKLGAGDIPVLYVYNKIDLCDRKMREQIPKELSFGKNDSIYLSARNTADIERLSEKIKEQLYGEYVTEEFLFPYEDGSLVSFFLQNFQVLHQKYVESGVWLVVKCHQDDVLRYQNYCIRNRV